MSVAFTLLYAVGGNGFLLLLTDEDVVVQSAGPYFWWAVLIPLVSMSAFIYDGIFIGLTATRSMLASSVVSALSFFALFLALQSRMGNHALWLAFIVYLGLRGGIQCFLYRRMHLSWVQK
jgi:hypothetical protein